MELTQKPVTSDWQGEPIEWGHTYLLVDYATAILYEANDPYDLIEFLKTNYPDDVAEYNPKFPSQWMELLSNCTTTPEFHLSNMNDELDTNTEISEGSFEIYNSADEQENDELKEMYL